MLSECSFKIDHKNCQLHMSHFLAELNLPFPFRRFTYIIYTSFSSGNVALHPESSLSYVFGGILAGKSRNNIALCID